MYQLDMSGGIVTSDKSFLKRYGRNSKPLNSGEICNYCGQPKRQFGSGKNRMDVCGCTSSAIRLPSGKNIKRNQKF